jgi:hypothetical protein
LRMKLEWRVMKPDWGEMKLESMRGVRVLEVSGFKSLPSSTFGLTNLRALHLVSCKLEMTSLISNLENLEILNLGMSDFKELPKEVGQLKKLKLLDLSGCKEIREIAAGVISGLVDLEELLMLDSFSDWEAEEDGKERKKASLAEVASLRKLVTLEIDIHNPKIVSLETQKLERYCLRIGDTFSEFEFEDICKKNVFLESKSDLRNFCPSMTRNAENLILKGDGCMAIFTDLVAARNPEVKSTN